MNLRRQGLTLALMSMISLGAAQAASAATVLVFGQNGVTNTVTMAANGAQTQTTITGTDIPVTITALENQAGTVAAFLDISVTSNGTAVLGATGNIEQHFSGNISFNSLANNTGTNFLTVHFSDLGSGAPGGSQLTLGAGTPSDTIDVFTSSVITSLGFERALSIAFTNLSSPLAICGTTLCGATSSVAGNFSGNIQQVPEPASLLLFGAGLAGVAARFRRRR